MKEARFVFVGNRRFVLEAMLEAKVNIVQIFVVEGTHLERDISGGELGKIKSYEVINNRKDLIDHLQVIKFDVLVSNGCPYILPISALPKANYINIHPSLLPDLRGYDPVIGSILYQRDAGATCHLMDEGIDTGDIISQVPIPYTNDLDVTTLYQLSFIAEKKAFVEALMCGFEPCKAQNNNEEIISYKRNKKDWVITFCESNDYIIQKIRSFNNFSQGARFFIGDIEYKVLGGEKMTNPFLKDVVFARPAGEVVFSYEGSVIFHKDGDVIRLMGVVSVVDGSILSLQANLLDE